MTVLTVIFFETKIRSATLATKINKNQGVVLKTIVVNLVVKFRQFKDYLLFLPKRMQRRCISGQNKMIVSTRCSESSMPWEGVKGLRS